MNILSAGNDNYIFATKIFLSSLLKNRGKDGIKIYFLYSSLSEESINSLQEFIGKAENSEIHFIYIDKKIFKNAPIKALTNPYITIETYYRMAMSEVLPEQIDRILYLDTDIIINKNIGSFYKSSFDGKAAIVCDDYGITMSKKIRKKVYGNIGFAESERYFNAGVILINMEYMRKHIRLDDFLDYISMNHNSLIFHDQDVLNVMLKNRVKYEDYNKYNCRPFYYPFTDKYEKMIDNAYIIHYGEKPWNDSFSDLGGDIFWKHARSAGFQKEYIEWKKANRKYFKENFLPIVAKRLKRNIKSVIMNNG